MRVMDDGPSTDFRDAALPFPKRRMFCNRTLNLRSIKAVGFDMDYTLVHYRTEQWEGRAYTHVRQRLLEHGWPVQDLKFDPDLVALGLILDVELGNVVKANRFGYVKRACHGTRPLRFEDQRAAYSRVLVDLGEPRWQFMNTLFSLSEACLYMQLVDLLDEGQIPGTMGYRDLYDIVRSSIDAAHMLGELKAEIVAKPEPFVELDPDVPLALLDMKHAGKKLLLITNSEWSYAEAMMSYTFDRYLPGTWRDVFDLVLVGARKPEFFTQRGPVFEIVSRDGLLRPVVGGLNHGGAYVGGHAALVETHLELRGEEILYVGDHIYSDVRVSKNLHRWRSALVVRELERDLEALERYREQQRALHHMMKEKELLEHRYSLMRLAVQRAEHSYGPQPEQAADELRDAMHDLRKKLVDLDERIAPLAKSAGELSNPRWGLLMRTGNDKSHLARQIERHADVYTSRVANLLYQTPFVYLRSPRGSLPHDG